MVRVKQVMQTAQRQETYLGSAELDLVIYPGDLSSLEEEPTFCTAPAFPQAQDPEGASLIFLVCALLLLLLPTFASGHLDLDDGPVAPSWTPSTVEELVNSMICKVVRGRVEPPKN